MLYVKVKLGCGHWFHIPKICPFYGNFGREGVPHPFYVSSDMLTFADTRRARISFGWQSVLMFIALVTA